jgi:hypothetical protein
VLEIGAEGQCAGSDGGVMVHELEAQAPGIFYGRTRRLKRVGDLKPRQDGAVVRS